MIRLAPWDVGASPLATASDDAAAAQALGRFAPRERRLGFWLALWAAAIAAEFGALVPVIFPGEEQVAGRAGRLPAHRRLVRGVRPDRLAPAAGQPQRPADDRDRASGFSSRPLLEPVPRRRVAQTRRSLLAGPLGALLRRAAADVPHRRAARVARRPGARRARSCWPCASCSVVWLLFSEQDGQPAGRLPERRHRRRGRQDAALAGSASPASPSPSWSPPAGGRRRGRGGGRCCRASRARAPAAVRRAAGQRPRDRLALAASCSWAAVLLARERPGGVPRRAAALAARPRRPRGPLPRAQHDARRRPAGGAGQDARRPDARASPIGCPESLGYADADGRPVLRAAGRRRPRHARRSSATAARSRRSSTTRRSTTTPSWSRRSAPRRRSRSRTSACTPRREARLAELQASRQRIVAAGDAERRRLERNLHDGAQQRLVALVAAAAADPGPHPQRPRDRPSSSSSTASDELAPVARGAARARARDPPGGARPRPRAGARVAGGALDGARPTVAVDAPSRLPEPVELAAYFVASEALANVAKYAAGDRGDACASRARGRGAAIEIADDGVGGADAARGSGLRGLADRVEALDGRLRVVSPPGAGTVVTRGAAVRVVIADDSLLVREGIAALLRARGRRGGGAGGVAGRAARARSTRHVPDVAIVDVRMPPTHTDEGLRAAHEIRARHPADGDPDPLPARRGRDRDAPAGREPGGPRLPAQGPRHRRSRTSSARCAASPPAARRSTPRWSTRCSPTPRDDGPAADRSPTASARCSSWSPRAAPTRPSPSELTSPQRSVEKHVTSIFAKLDLPATGDEHRRVLAVLQFLRA